jgi:predicted nuclease of predicted toxin-antitoxin system
MRFLADESCDFAVVRALRSADHDVVAIAEVSPREEDPSVMDRAVKDSRILVTEDKDFGQLVYARMQRTGGVIFIRFPGQAHAESDLDVLLIVKNEAGALKRELRRIGYLLAATTDVLPSILAYTQDEWESRKRSGSTFRQAVERDAVRVL